jgi:hypothetical protein
VIINIPKIAKYEWHPFTISSSPDLTGYVWLHIRGVGTWTKKLYDYYEEKEDEECKRKSVKRAKIRQRKARSIKDKERYYNCHYIILAPEYIYNTNTEKIMITRLH